MARKPVEQYLTEIEWRLDSLERRVHALEELRADFNELRELITDPRYDIEELQEA